MNQVREDKEKIAALLTREDQDKYFLDQADFMRTKSKIERIDNFNGAFDFLNNEYPSTVYYEGRFYPSVFHAFQAARSDKDHERAKISLAESMQELFELAIEIDDPEDWFAKRLIVMERCVRDKFRRNRDLARRLRKTGNRDLINSYSEASESNCFWGIVNGKGSNHLGSILTNVRLDIHKDLELFRWLYMIFKPQENKKLIPRITLEVYKDDEKLEEYKLEGKSFHLFGTIPNSDFVLAHPSISRRHACILIDEDKGPLIIDLGSKSGTFLNGERLNENFPYEISDKDYFSVASSTRSYLINIDYKEVEEYVERKKQDLDVEVKILKLKSEIQKKKGKDYDLNLRMDTVFISGLPNNCNEAKLENALKEFGVVTETRIPIDRRTGKQRDIAFVRFKNENGAKAAVQAAKVVVDDIMIVVRFAEKNKTQILRDLEDELVNSDWRKEKYTTKRDSRSREHSRRKQKHHSRSRDRRRKREKSSKHKEIKKKEKKRKRKTSYTSSSASRKDYSDNSSRSSR